MQLNTENSNRLLRSQGGTITTPTIYTLLTDLFTNYSSFTLDQFYSKLLLPIYHKYFKTIPKTQRFTKNTQIQNRTPRSPGATPKYSDKFTYID